MADDHAPEHSPSSSLSAQAQDVESPLRRPVYEPSLFPARPRRRVSRWIVIPLMLATLLGVWYFLLAGPHSHRFVPTKGLIVYASDEGTPGHSHLWLMGLDGSGQRRLSGSATDESAPAFSPDGSQIAFVAPINSNPQVFTADADGQNRQPATRNAGAKQQPAFAPGDGSRLGYMSGGVLSTANSVSGDTLRLLPPAPDATRAQGGDTLINSPTVSIGSFAWQPAKEQSTPALAAVEETGDVQALVLLPSPGGKPRDTQTDQPGSAPLAAAQTATLGWSPSGSLLAVALLGVKGLPPGRAVSAIVLFDSAGGSALQRPLAVTQSSRLGPERPVFSPDGSQIAFELWQQPDLAHARCVGLFAVAVDGNAPPHSIVQGDAEHARWTPDGQRLLFLRQRGDGGHSLYQINADGRGLARLSSETSDVSSFQVSPQGQATP